MVSEAPSPTAGPPRGGSGARRRPPRPAQPRQAPLCASWYVQWLALIAAPHDTELSLRAGGQGRAGGTPPARAKDGRASGTNRGVASGLFAPPKARTSRCFGCFYTSPPHWCGQQAERTEHKEMQSRPSPAVVLWFLVRRSLTPLRHACHAPCIVRPRRLAPPPWHLARAPASGTRPSQRVFGRAEP